MARMKRFLLYLIIFVALYIYTTAISNWGAKTLTGPIEDIEILTEYPIITVDNCVAGKYSGNISGTVRNNTGKHIEKAYLKLDFYNNQQKYIGSKYEELKYFNVNELLKFDTTFKGKDVKALKLSVVYERTQVEQISEQSVDWSFGNIMTKENLNIALPIVSGMLLYYILGIL